MRITRFKIFSIFALFGIVIALLSFAVYYQYIHAKLQEEFHKDALQILKIKEEAFRVLTATAKGQIEGLKQSSVFLRYLEHPRGEDERKLSEFVIGFLSAHPSLLTVEYLDLSGRERFKVARETPASAIHVFDSKNLSDTGQSRCFKALSQITEERLFFYELGLHHPRKEASAADQPLLAAGTPIFLNGRKAGYLKLSITLEEYFRSFKSIDIVTLYLIDADGHFIYHPDPEKSWSDQRGTPYSIETAFPETYRNILDNSFFQNDQLLSLALHADGHLSLKLIALKNHEFYNMVGQPLFHQVVAALALIVALSLVVAFFLGNVTARLYSYLDSIINAMGEGLYVLDKGHRIQLMNKATESLLGYSEAELMHKNSHYIFHPTDKEGHPKPIEECPVIRLEKTLEPVHNLRDAFLTKSHRFIDVELTSTPLFINGSYSGSVTVFRDITKDLALQAELKETTEQYRLLVENSLVGIFRTNLDGDILFANCAAYEMLGYRKEDDTPNVHELYLHRGNRAQILHELQRHTRIQATELEVKTKSGAIKTFLLNATLHEGIISGMVADISGTIEDRENLRRLSRVVEQVKDSVLMTDTFGIVTYVNEAFEKQTGYRAEEVLGQNVNRLKSGRQDAAFYQNLWNSISKGETFKGMFINKKRNGEIYYEDKTISPIIDEKGAITAYVSSAKDITSRIHMEEELKAMAERDYLTGLYNRIKFESALEYEFNRNRRYGDPFSLIMLDIDHFKLVNDTYGHDVGDTILQEFAHLLRSSMRTTDIIARWGGEEFMLLLPNSDGEQARHIAEKLRESITRTEFTKVGRMSASMGVCEMKANFEMSDLLKYVDDALYKAKRRGRDCIVVT